MNKLRTYEEAVSVMSEARRRKIQNRTNDLLFAAELEMLRKSRKISQKELALKLAVSQPAIAKMETEADMRISTLKRFVEGIGGSLRLEINFPEGARHVIIP